MKNFIAAIALILLTGCQSDDGGGCRSARTKPAQPDAASAGVVLNLLAAELNRQQTNWTVTITPRTNAP